MASDSYMIVIETSGAVRFIYDDGLADLLALGKATVKRASVVEPAEGGGWIADLSAMDGPSLGPFWLRGDALAAEARWLKQHMLQSEIVT